MNLFEKKVLNFIRENAMAEPGMKVLVGFSGGADSTALLLSLYEMRQLLEIELMAVHVNHGIRQDAGEDALFTEEFCKTRGIQYFVLEENVPELSKKWDMTEEEAGRKLRYDAFSRIAKENGAERIAVAHHQNDVAETLLLNLLRGTGLHGAGAIRPVRDNIIRPLLCVSRREIEDYLAEKEQSFCRDYTNDENFHTRNIIRNILIPEMERSINPAAASHLCRAAAEFARADEYISGAGDVFFQKTVDVAKDKVVIDLSELKDAPPIIKSQVVLKAFEQITANRKDITASHVDSIMKLMEDTRGTASVDLPYSLRAVRSYDRMEISKTEDLGEPEFAKHPIPKGLKPGDELEITLQNIGVAHIKVMAYNGGKLFPASSCTKWFDYDRIQEAIFRTRKASDFMLIEQGSGLCRKQIGKLMTDLKIPKGLRDKLYLLTDGDNVLWIPGYRMSGAYKINEDTKTILEIKIDFYNGGNADG
jgi:tRNA(Ile)-lysidine synthase